MRITLSLHSLQLARFEIHATHVLRMLCNTNTLYSLAARSGTQLSLFLLLLSLGCTIERRNQCAEALPRHGSWQSLIRQEEGRACRQSKRTRYRCSAPECRQRQCKYDRFSMTNKNSHHKHRSPSLAARGCDKRKRKQKCTLQFTDVLYFITCYSSIIHLWQWHDRLQSAEKPDWRLAFKLL